MTRRNLNNWYLEVVQFPTPKTRFSCTLQHALLGQIN